MPVYKSEEYTNREGAGRPGSTHWIRPLPLRFGRSFCSVVPDGCKAKGSPCQALAWDSWP